MPATSVTEEEVKSGEMIDDLSEVETIDPKKLAALEALNQVKQQEEKMVAKIVAKKERSLNLGIFGSGQAGSRLAETFYKLGYDACVCNTTLVDLKFINLPDSNKLLLEYGPGGASKELEIGKAAAETNRAQIVEFINEKLSASQVNVLCLSLGGGSGAGSASVLIDILSEIGKPIVVLCILPMDSEDVQAKSNSLETLSMLAGFVKSKKVSNLIVVDNAKIEALYSNVSQLKFFDIANQAIVEPIDMFNTLSSMASSTKGMDQMEFSKVFIDGEGLSVFGQMTIDNYEDPTGIAEAIMKNLSGNLLASGFDLLGTKYASFMIAANEKVLDKIPSASINYANSLITEVAGSPKNVFRGTYCIDIPENVVKVYSFFSGLSLPAERIQQLKTETAELQAKSKNKDEQRNLTMQLDTGKNETISAAQKVKEKIAAKSSAFGKLLGGSINDRRGK